MVKNLCFDQFYANLTQTCQIQLAFPHLAVRPLCLSLFFLPTSLSQRPFSLSTTVLPSFHVSLGLCFYYPLNTCLNKTFSDLLPQPSCLVLGYCTFFSAQTLPFFPYPEAWHHHPTRVMLHILLPQISPATLQNGPEHKQWVWQSSRLLFNIPHWQHIIVAVFQLFYTVAHVDPGSWRNAEPGL